MRLGEAISVVEKYLHEATYDYVIINVHSNHKIFRSWDVDVKEFNPDYSYNYYVLTIYENGELMNSNGEVLNRDNH